jgi:hypothetical protein
MVWSLGGKWTGKGLLTETVPWRQCEALSSSLIPSTRMYAVGAGAGVEMGRPRRCRAWAAPCQEGAMALELDRSHMMCTKIREGGCRLCAQASPRWARSFPRRLTRGGRLRRSCSRSCVPCSASILSSALRPPVRGHTHDNMQPRICLRKAALARPLAVLARTFCPPGHVWAGGTACGTNAQSQVRNFTLKDVASKALRVERPVHVVISELSAMWHLCQLKNDLSCADSSACRES